MLHAHSYFPSPNLLPIIFLLPCLFRGDNGRANLEWDRNFAFCAYFPNLASLGEPR